MNVVIVGAGVMGLATAVQLAGRGHRVTVLEQGPVPNPKAGSVDSHRLIRFAYGDEHGYASMVGEAYAAWERLWAALGRSHLVATGQLLTGPEGEPWIEGSLRSFERLGVPYERLGAGDLGHRFPMLDPDRVPHAVWTPTGGVLLADRIVRDLAARAIATGVTVRAETRVRAVDLARGEASLEAGGTVGCDRLLVTAGPWVDRLVPELAGVVVPSRQTVVYAEPPPALASAWREAPMITDVLTAEDTVFYAVPPVAGTRLKLGDHVFSREGDPDESRDARPEGVAAILGVIGRRLRDPGEYRVLEARSCFYDVVADERFRVLAQDRGLVLAGFSGHGFKFGAVVGERAAVALEDPGEIPAFTSWLAGRAVA